MKKCGEMDSRCPRALPEMPETFCPLAVLRLKAIRNADREFSEEEEAALPGCPWAVNHQVANYCFFKFIKEFSGDKPLSDVEIASLNGISVDSVKRSEKSGLIKIKGAEEFKKLKEMYGDDSIVSDTDDDPDYSIYR